MEYVLKAGRLSLFTLGAYSSYQFRGLYVALKDLTLDELKEKVKPLKSGNEYADDMSQVEALLIREGYLLEVDFTEVYLGDCLIEPGVGYY